MPTLQCPIEQPLCGAAATQIWTVRSVTRDRFKLNYPLLYCGSVDDSNVDKQLKSQLENFFAYPTTLFIDKKGKVRAVHAGFHGPGTGDQFPFQVQKLHELAAQVAR